MLPRGAENLLKPLKGALQGRGSCAMVQCAGAVVGMSRMRVKQRSRHVYDITPQHGAALGQENWACMVSCGPLHHNNCTQGTLAGVGEVEGGGECPDHTLDH